MEKILCHRRKKRFIGWATELIRKLKIICALLKIFRFCREEKANAYNFIFFSWIEKAFKFMQKKPFEDLLFTLLENYNSRIRKQKNDDCMLYTSGF